MSETFVMLLVGAATVTASVIGARYTAIHAIRAEGMAARQRAYDSLLATLSPAAEAFVNNPHKFSTSPEWSALQSSQSIVAIRGSDDVSALVSTLLVHMHLTLDQKPVPRSTTPASAELVRDVVADIRRSIKSETVAGKPGLLPSRG